MSKYFTFVWTIDLDFYYEDQFRRLKSPVFTVNTPDKTTWLLELYPNKSEYITLELTRLPDNGSVDRKIVNFEISSFSSDGSLLGNRKASNRGFLKGKSWICNNFVKRCDVFKVEKKDLLPCEGFTLRYRMSIGSTDIEGICLARTIGLRSPNFIWSIEDFSSFQLQQRNILAVETNSGQNSYLNFELFLDEDEQVQIEITRAERQPPIHAICNISLLNIMEKEDDHYFKLSPDRSVWRFPSFLTKPEIMENKCLYLPKDVLHLQCKCTTTEIEAIEMKDNKHIPVKDCGLNSNYSMAMKYDKQCMTKPEGSAFTNSLSKCKEGVPYDFSLQVGTKTFPVHKAVLSAISSVFKDMIVNNMKESKTGCIDIPDIDEKTMHQILLFVYTDTLEAMDWDGAMKLYIAADKYAIEQLKNRSKTILLKSKL